MTRGRPELVSVVIPALNVEHTIGEQLEALTRQTYEGPWEVVLVDNGCTDASLVVARSFEPRLPALRVVDATDREGLNHARNVGAREAQGDFLAFCDGDDAVVPWWLDALVRLAPEADIVGGRLEVEDINAPLTLAWHPGSRQERLPDGGYGFLPYASGGNCGIWASVARDLGWDERFTLGGADYEFCWRAQLRSYRLAYAHDAVLQRRYRPRLWAVAHQHYRYGRSHPLLYKCFRDQGFRWRPLSEAVADVRWIAANAWRALVDAEMRGRWVRAVALRCGRLAGSLRERVLVL